MKYNYNSELGAFVREDGLGKKFWITMVEAHRIMTLYELGVSPNQIGAKIQFKNPKTTVSSVSNFIKNVENGDIVLDNDVPLPVEDFDDINLEARITEIESRVSSLENKVTIILHSIENIKELECSVEHIQELLEKPCECECKEEESISDKVKAWLKS